VLSSPCRPSTTTTTTTTTTIIIIIIIIIIGLDNGGSRVRFLVGAGNFSLHHLVQGAHPVSYQMALSHSPTSSAEIKHAWSYTSTPQYAFMAWCLVKHRDNFTFTFICWHILRQSWEEVVNLFKVSFLTHAEPPGKR
jgi:hypothetical protein